jgi:hypothetical protein
MSNFCVRCFGILVLRSLWSPNQMRRILKVRGMLINTRNLNSIWKMNRIKFYHWFLTSTFWLRISDLVLWRNLDFATIQYIKSTQDSFMSNWRAKASKVNKLATKSLFCLKTVCLRDSVQTKKLCHNHYWCMLFWWESMHHLCRSISCSTKRDTKCSTWYR